MSLHCIRGCVVPRRHIVQTCLCDCHQGAQGAYECSVVGGCYEAHQHPDDCMGCLPREATVGQLCIHCHGKLTEAIGKVPDLVAHLRAHIEPGAVRRDDMPRASGKHSPAPLNPDAVDTADELYTVLAEWHDRITEELELSAFTPAAYMAGGKLHGIPAQGVNSAAAMARRLSTHLDRACIYEWSGEMVSDLSEVVRKALHRYPDEERPLYLPTPCPACDMLSLVRTAPQAFEGSAVISCRTCKNTIAEELYGWQARKVLAEKREEARAESERFFRSRLLDIAGLEPDWDGSGSQVPSVEVLERAGRLVPVVAAQPSPVTIIPNSEGAVVFEWRRGRLALTASIEPDGGMFLFVDNVTTDESDDFQGPYDHQSFAKFLTAGAMP